MEMLGFDEGVRVVLPETLHGLVLDKRSDEPFWRQLFVQLNRLIVSGVLLAGSSLPSERDMAAALGVSRVTVKRCYDELRQTQQLAGRGRGGSVVQAVARVSPTLGQLKGFTQEMRELGREASSRVESISVVQDRMMASMFAQPSNAEFLHLVRVRCADGVPMTREVAWYALNLVPNLATWDGVGSAYSLIQASMGEHLGEAEQSIEAVMSSTEEMRVFDFASPQPCLLLKRQTYTAKGALVEYVEGCFRGDAYVYRLKLAV